MVGLTDRLNMTIVVDLDVKPTTNQTQQQQKNLAKISPRKVAFENFCSRSEREKRAFFLG